MNANLEVLLHDIAAQLALTTDLPREARLVVAVELVAAQTALPIELLEVRCAVFSRSALFHLGGAMVPATRSEARQFREQARGGFVELGTADSAHVVLLVGDFVLDCAHSAEWNDRGVWIRPFVSTFAPPTWVADRLPFGVRVAYDVSRAYGEDTGKLAA
jgi:hypothetical protein